MLSISVHDTRAPSPLAALLDQFRCHLPLLPGAVVAVVRRLADRWPLGLASSANRPPEIEQLAKALCGDDQDPALLAQGRIIAENQLIWGAIRLQKVRAIEQRLAEARMSEDELFGRTGGSRSPCAESR